MDIYLLLGSLGAGMVLIAFLLSNNGKWKVSTPGYDWLNLIGSIFLLIYAVAETSIPFIITNFVWIIFSGWDLLKPRFKKRVK